MYMFMESWGEAEGRLEEATATKHTTSTQEASMYAIFASCISKTAVPLTYTSVGNIMSTKQVRTRRPPRLSRVVNVALNSHASTPSRNTFVVAAVPLPMLLKGL